MPRKSLAELVRQVVRTWFTPVWFERLPVLGWILQESRQRARNERPSSRVLRCERLEERTHPGDAMHLLGGALLGEALLGSPEQPSQHPNDDSAPVEPTSFQENAAPTPFEPDEVVADDGFSQQHSTAPAPVEDSLGALDWTDFLDPTNPDSSSGLNPTSSTSTPNDVGTTTIATEDSAFVSSSTSPDIVAPLEDEFDWVDDALSQTGTTSSSAPLSSTTTNLGSTSSSPASPSLDSGNDEVAASTLSGSSTGDSDDIAANSGLAGQKFATTGLAFEPILEDGSIEARFRARGVGYQIQFLDNEVVLRLRKNEAGKVGRDEIRLRFHGANATPVIVGEGLLPTTSHYFSGDDPTQWKRDVPHFSKVVYHNLYDGIDAVFYGTAENKLEFDLVVHPKADPSQIRIGYSGPSKKLFETDGRYRLETKAGLVRQSKPIVYQEDSTGRRTVLGDHHLDGNGRLKFQLGSYDSTKTLVIDPILDFSHAMTTLDPTDLTVDGQGNIYIAGVWEDFGDDDIFIRKIDPNGNVLFTAYYGGTGIESDPRILLDSTGNLFVAGTTGSSDLPTTVGVVQATSAGGKDFFLARFSSLDGSLLTSGYYGGSQDDVLADIALDSTGKFQVVGHSKSTDFPTLNPAQAGNAGGFDITLSTLDALLTTTHFGTYFGSTEDDLAARLVLDDNDLATLVGTTSSRDLAVTADAFQRRYGGGDSDVLLVSFTAGGAVASLTYSGGLGADTASDLVRDADGNLYFTGATASPDYPTRNPHQGYGKSDHDDELDPQTDAFFSQVLADGRLGFSSYFGTTNGNAGVSVAVGPQGRVYLLGTTQSDNDFDFPTKYELPGTTNNNAFLSAFTPNGMDLVFSTHTSGTGLDLPSAMVLVGGSLYLAGGNNSSPGDGAVLKIDPTLPNSAAPIIWGVQSHTADGNHVFTTDSTPTLTGLAAPNQTVKVLDPLLTGLGSATADSDGLWSLTLASPLSAGTTALTVAKDEALGSDNRPSKPILVSLDDTAPSVTILTTADTIDRRPEVFVRVTDRYGIPDGTVVTLTGWGGSLQARTREGVARFRLPVQALGTLNLTASASDRAGNSANGNAALTVVSAGTPWQLTASALNWDPDEGSPLESVGSARTSVALDIDQSPGRLLDSALVYDSSTVDARPVIHASLTTDASVGLPNPLKVTLTWDGVPQAEQQFDTAGFSAGETLLFGVRPDSPVLGSGLYSWSLTVVAELGQSTETRTVAGLAHVVDRSTSPFGAGWSLSVLDQLVPVTDAQSTELGQLRLLGDGGSRYYTHLGSGVYTSEAGDSGTLAKLVDGSFSYTTPEGWTRLFDPAGLQTDIVSPDGFDSTQFGYTAGLLTSITTADGAVTTLGYTAGKLTSLSTGSRVISLSQGSTLTGIDQFGEQDSFAYDSVGKMLSHSRDVLPQKWSYTDGIVDSVTLGDEDTTRITPLALVGLGSLASGVAIVDSYDAFDRLHRTTLDDRGRVLTTQDPTGAVETWTRDSNGWVTGHTDALGRSTTFALDGQGYVTLETFADATTRAYTYQSAFHALTSVTDQRGHTTNYAYNANGHLITETDALGHITNYAYTDGLLTSVNDPLDQTTTFEYDVNRRLIKETDELGNYSETTYNSDGNPATFRDKRGHTTSFVHDLLGRMTSRTNAMGDTATWTYVGTTDLVESFTNEMGTKFDFEYDKHGGLIDDPTNPALRYVARDRTGAVVAEADGNTHSTQYQTRGLGQMAVVTNAAQGQTLSRVDLAGQTVETVDVLGRTNQLAYDSMGRVTTATDALGYDTTFDYDSAGNSIRTTDALNRKTRTDYDELGRVTKVVEAEGSTVERQVSFDYDALGNILTQTDGRGTVTAFAYNDLYHLSQRTDAVGEAEERIYQFVTDALGNVTQQTDPLGLITQYTFDPLGRLTTQTEGTSPNPTRTKTHQYDKLGNEIITTDAEGNQTFFFYDSLSRIDGITPDDAGDTSFTYDRAGNVTKRTKLNNLGETLEVVTEFDPLDRVVRTIERGVDVEAHFDSRTIDTARDSAGNPILLLGPRDGQVTEQLFDERGQLVESRRKVDTGVYRLTTTIFDAVGNATSITDPLGRVTVNTYDDLDRHVRVDRPLGYFIDFDFDENDNLIRQTTPNNHVIEYTFDKLDRRTHVTEAVGTSLQRASQTVYDDIDNITQTIDPLGQTTTFTYDTLHRRTSMISPKDGSDTVTTTFQTDLLGRVTRVTDGDNRSVDNEYDAAGRVTKTIENTHLPANEQTVRETTYGFGNQVKSVDLGLQTVSQTKYNPWGQPYYILDSNGLLQLTYDDAGNLVQTKDGGAIPNITTYIFDLANQRTSATDALGNTTTFSYDTAGRLIQITDRNERQRQFVYDDLDRSTSEKWYDSSGTLVETITSTWDLNGNLENIANGLGTLYYSYDDLDRIETSTDVFGNTATVTYDALSRPTQVQTSFGVTRDYDYFEAGWLKELSQTTTGLPTLTVAWQYNDAGQPTSKTYKDSTDTYLVTAKTYGLDNRLTQIQATHGNRLIETFDYTYSIESGLVASESRTAWLTASNPSPGNDPEDERTHEQFTFSNDLSHDSQGQLVDHGSDTYSYDGTQNLIINGIQVGPGNRLIQDSVWTYTYDDEGNLTEKVKHDLTEKWEFEYDHHNRMTRSERWLKPNTTWNLDEYIDFGYSPSGQRVTLTKNGITNYRFYYDLDNQLWAELDSSNALVAGYLKGGPDNSLLGRVETGTSAGRYWYITDRTGNIAAIVDDNGAALKRLLNGPYSRKTVWYSTAGASGFVSTVGGGWESVSWTLSGPTGPSDPFDFAAREIVSVQSKLLYFDGRFYDTQTGRFLSEDPNGLAGTNLYRYAKNSPMNVKADPVYSRDALEAASNFFAATADTLTAGLTARYRRAAGYDDAVNYDSVEYKAGAQAGQALNIALIFANPAAMGLGTSRAFFALNGLSAVGNGLNALEALGQKEYGQALMMAGSSVLSLFRGNTPCRWNMVVGGLQRGLHMMGASQSAQMGIAKLQNGEYIGGLLDLIDAGANTYRMMQACFIAGTPMEMEHGSKPIEQVEVGETIMARDENDPEGPVVPKRVLEKFIRTATVLELDIAGQTIGTTAEHPFYVRRAMAWLPAGFIEPGDEVRTKAGDWVKVDAVRETGEIATVYNLHVEDYHTYFVGGDDWTFSVWVHNANNAYNPKSKLDNGQIRKGANALAKEIRANGGKTPRGVYDRVLPGVKLSEPDRSALRNYIKSKKKQFSDISFKQRGMDGPTGMPSTRRQLEALSANLRKKGWTIVKGGDSGVKEEWIPGPGKGREGGTAVDLTATKTINGVTHTLRIQTQTTTTPHGTKPTKTETAAAKRIRTAFPNDTLIELPKNGATSVDLRRHPELWERS